MPTFDNATFHTGSGASASGSHTASGTDRYVFVLAGCGSGVASVSYGGNAMSGIDTVAASERLYGLVNPPTGAQTVTVTASSADDIAFAVISYTDVDQSTPFSGLQGASSTGTAPSVTVSSATGAKVVGGVISANFGTITSTPGAGQTERVDSFGASLWSLTWSDEDGSSSTTHSYTLSGSPAFGYRIMAGSLNPASTGDTLTIDSQPSTATSGEAMGTVVVESSDTASTATVTATIASGSGTLSGTTSVAMVAGVATFSNLIITGLGAFTLAFNATDHDEVVSSTITVSAPPAPPRVIVEFFRPS
jgi:hypothetical protein